MTAVQRQSSPVERQREHRQPSMAEPAPPAPPPPPPPPSAAADVLRQLTPAQLQAIIKTLKSKPEARKPADIGFIMDVVAELKFFERLSFKLQQAICRTMRCLQLKAGDTVFDQVEKRSFRRETLISLPSLAAASANA